MRRFRGTVQGEWEEVSRLGSEKSGLRVTADGQEFGVLVVMSVNPATGKDEAQVYRTGGNKGAEKRTLIATLREGEE